MPLILGNECSGIVEKVGVNVKNFKIGDKVYARLAINKPGSFAEYVAINYKDVAKMPGDIDFKTAAAIPLTGLTAYQAFKDILKVKAEKVFSLQVGQVLLSKWQFQLLKNLI